MKIDIFNHIAPKKFLDALLKKTPVKEIPPTLHDLDRRFRFMDRFEGLVQVVSVPQFDFRCMDNILDNESNVELCKLANDEMAELLTKYPDRFVGACASLPMTDVDEAVKEIDRSITALGLCGIQLYTSVKGQPLDAPEFKPVFERMNRYNLPILLHPTYSSAGDASTTPDMKPSYLSMVTISAPYATTLTLNRMVFSGMMEDYPNLKVIAHHCGGLLPLLASRIDFTYANARILGGGAVLKQRYLSRHPMYYFHKFYGDTVTSGTAALRCGLEFFGADHVLFGTDAPFDALAGIRATDVTINTIEKLNIAEEDRRKIYELNAIELFRLPVTIV